MSGLLSLMIAVEAANGADAPLGIVGVVVLFFLYFLPTLIAKSRKKANTGAVFALNFFLGWSLVGWVVALVWALAKDALCAGCGRGLLGGQTICVHCGRARG